MRRAILCVFAFGVTAIAGGLPATSGAKVSDDARRGSELRRAIDGGGAERHPVPRRRHGRLGDHHRPQLRVGAAGRLSMDALPLTGEYTTYAVQKGTPRRPRLRHRLGGVRHRLGDRATRPTTTPSPSTR